MESESDATPITTQPHALIQTAAEAEARAPIQVPVGVAAAVPTTIEAVTAVVSGEKPSVAWVRVELRKRGTGQAWSAAASHRPF